MNNTFLTILFLQSCLASAQTSSDAYTVEPSGLYYLALPKSLQVSASRQESRPLPSCDALSRYLEPMLKSIEQCGDPESRNDEFCKYTTSLVRQKVLGIRSEITRVRELDAKQQWQIDVRVNKDSVSDLKALASELGAVDEQLPRPVSLNATLSLSMVDTSKSRLLSLLAKLDAAELAEIKVADSGGGRVSVETTSRAVTCEVLAGNVTLLLESHVVGSYNIPVDQKQMTKLWNMKLALEPLLTWTSKQDRYKYIVAGHRMAAFEDQDRPDELESSVLADAERLIDFNASSFKLVYYKNKFSLGQTLPQTKVESRSTIKQAWTIR